MQKLMLNTVWTMQRCGDTASYHCTVPCSVYDTLVTHGAIESPYYRENEREAFTLSEEDYVFSTTFPSPAEPTAHMALCFDGIDTIADITLNGELLGVVPASCPGDKHFALPGALLDDIQIGSLGPVDFHPQQLFQHSEVSELNVAVLVGADVSAPVSPAVRHALAGATVLAAVTGRRQRPDPALFAGAGKVDEIAAAIGQGTAELDGTAVTLDAMTSAVLR